MSILYQLRNYFSATLNEEAIDRYMYLLAGQNASNFSYLPRPSKIFNSFLIKILKKIDAIGLIKVIWITFGSDIYIIINYIKLLEYKHKCYSRRNSLGKYSLLAYSDKAISIFNHLDSFHSETVIFMPWLKSIKNRKFINILELSNLKELIFSAILAKLSVVFFLVKQPRNILQTYTAFRWFVVYYAIRKISSKIVICSHYDRWAVLTDIVAREKGSTFILIQHGRMPDTESINNKSFQLPYKLKRVEQLFAYDDNSVNFFLKNVLELSNGNSIAIKKYKPFFEFYNLQTNPPNILFIGHPLCEKFHIYILKNLSANFKGISYYYKPHPRNPCSTEVYKQSWQIIKGEEAFPIVDLVITYPSTLIDQYNMINVNVLVHPLNFKNSFDFYLSKILSAVSELVRAKNY